jgi:hypothetical protein
MLASVSNKNEYYYTGTNNMKCNYNNNNNNNINDKKYNEFRLQNRNDSQINQKEGEGKEEGEKDIIYEILNDRRMIENQIKSILQNFEKNLIAQTNKNGIYIYGPSGCGKTHFIKKILKDMNYDIIHYDSGDSRNKAVIETMTSDNISNQNVLTMMKRQKQNIAIIMDEIDGMNTGDKGSITSLIKLIRQKKTKKQKIESKTNNPIICIGNNFVDKKIKELMNVCNVFEMKGPTDEQIMKIFEIKAPNMNEKSKTSLLKYIQGDLRRLNFILKIYNKNPKLLNEENMNQAFQLKTYNDHSKNITESIIHCPIPLKEHNLKINDTDRTIVALLWHENIVDVISLLEKQKGERFFNLYLKILKNICFADYIDRITFQNQIWQFNEMSSLIKTFYCNKIYHDFLSETQDPCHTHKITNIRFTKILTKYSTEYNNILFIYRLCNELNVDKKDLVSYFQEMRMYYKDYSNIEMLNQIHLLINNVNIDKLDIRRMYRFMDKNIKKGLETMVDDDLEIEIDLEQEIE